MSDKTAEIKPRGVVRYMQGVIIVLVVVLVLVLVLEIKGTKTASRTTTSTNRMTNKISVPQPIFSPKKFLFRSDWTLAASGGAHMKLQRNGFDFIFF